MKLEQEFEADFFYGCGIDAGCVIELIGFAGKLVFFDADHVEKFRCYALLLERSGQLTTQTAVSVVVLDRDEFFGFFD